MQDVGVGIEMHGYGFTSAVFSVEPGEDSETSDGRYGKQVAEWLKVALNKHGYDVSAIVAERWGRCVVCSTSPARLWVGVGNMDPKVAEPGDSDTDPDIIWHCFVSADLPLWARLFRRRQIRLALHKLDAAVGSILAACDEITLVPEP